MALGSATQTQPSTSSDATLTCFPVSALLLRGPARLPGHVNDVSAPVQPSVVCQAVPSFTELWIELNKWEPCFFCT